MSVSFSGETGIRTLGTVARTTVFETVPFNHSGISPLWVQDYIFRREITNGLFIRILVCLIIPESVEKLFGLVDIAVVPVAKNDNSS